MDQMAPLPVGIRARQMGGIPLLGTVLNINFMWQAYVMIMCVPYLVLKFIILTLQDWRCGTNLSDVLAATDGLYVCLSLYWVDKNHY